MITLENKIGYIRKVMGASGERLEYIEVAIKSVRNCRKGVRVYTDVFTPLDADELEANTKWLEDAPSIVLICEPFITNPKLAMRCRTYVGHWNEREDNIARRKESADND